MHDTGVVPGREAQPGPLDGLPAPFGVDVRPARQRVVVAPRGELDLATVDQLGAELDELVSRGFGSIVLDLRALDFMDSAGLRLVLRQAARADATVSLIDGSPPVRRLLDLTGVRSQLRFEEAA